MPCNSEILVTVELGEDVDTGLLLAALRRVGAQPARHASGEITFALQGARGTFRDKRLNLLVARGSAQEREAVNQIKAAYSYEVVMSAVRRVGAAAQVDARQQNVVHVRLAEGR